jgi:hypothetical protein
MEIVSGLHYNNVFDQYPKRHPERDIDSKMVIKKERKAGISIAIAA